MAAPLDVDQRLAAHLATWVGTWPPPSSGVTVVGDEARLAPTWDGSIRPLLGVGDGDGIVIAVPPAHADDARRLLADGLERPGLGDELGTLLGVGPARLGTGVFRSTTEVDGSIEPLGTWFDRYHPDLPDWLAPFNGDLLVAFDGDVVLGAVGIKVHDHLGHELAVVTEEAARGRGVARRLVATAARRVIESGGVPTYLHEPSNLASAHVAEAVGFADEGWTVHGLWPTERT